VEEAFRKDLTHLSWAEVYARQERRAHLVDAWMDALRLAPGDRVLEVGAGPGFVTMLLADRVGAGGIVYAVDISAEALSHLERLLQVHPLPQVRPLVADAAKLGPSGISATSALISMVLHHAEDPAALLRGVARLLPLGCPVVVAEFHPEGPGEQGPPASHRIDPKALRAWCEEAGLAVLEYRRQTPEHYMLLVRRT
jgi:ubiquinone/menaquinone biosynthesis C-methylase UbiE